MEMVRARIRVKFKVTGTVRVRMRREKKRREEKRTFRKCMQCQRNVQQNSLRIKSYFP